MGRHSTHQQADFVKSAFMWFLPWVLGGVVALGALWIALDAAFGGGGEPPADEPRGAPAAGAADPSPDAEPSPSPSPSPEPTVSDAGAGSDGDGGERDKKKPRLISDGVTVQVLNGTAVSDADDRIADELEGLGFDIVAVNDWRAVPETVVYWSVPGAEKEALLLADKFDWAAEPKPSELSSEVRLHVLVGADEASP